jgi:hypothetical protein
MAAEIHSVFVNYYEYLNVHQGSDTAEIKEALEKLISSAEAQLNNPLTMKNARQIVNEVIPAIRQHLLSDVRFRAEYDRQLLEEQRRQAHRGELADAEGLDDPLRQPFFFDPFEGYDTETPAFSLRQIAMKLDEEWARARTWITDTSDQSHVFVGYLIHVAGRERLARRIDQIIATVTRQTGRGMDINEAIERCIYILDPQIERPVVDVFNDTFDGRVLHAGDFISDQPAHTELILGHTSLRGCAFGTIESRTDWLRFPGGRAVVHFSLMPEGTDSCIGLSHVKIPLLFQLSRLERNTEHTAQLTLHIANHEPAIEAPVAVRIFVKPLPPRVSFEPVATADAPVWAGLTPCGTPGKAVVIARNTGDEQLVHLAAHLFTADSAARADLSFFHADEQITFLIDTRDRRRGKKYKVVFQVDYGASSEAIGPKEIHVQGELLPTLWQSMIHQRSLEKRLGCGCSGSIAGFVLIGSFCAGLAAHAGIAWLLFLALPILFAMVVRLSVATIARQMKYSGYSSATLKKMPTWVLRWLPLGLGLALALLSLFLPNGRTGFLIGAIIGGIVGAVMGFILDRTADPRRFLLRASA